MAGADGPEEETAVAASGEQGRTADTVCQRRLFLPTGDARLIALDPDTGERCTGFGDNGSVNLWANMPHKQEGFYYSTSPPVVTENYVIIGGAVNDNVSTREPSGVIRAYDVDTGELVCGTGIPATRSRPTRLPPAKPTAPAHPTPGRYPAWMKISV